MTCAWRTLAAFNAVPILFAALGLLAAALLFPAAARAEAGDAVVLLHGIGRTNITMAPLEGYLALKDYKVVNIDYPSREKPIEQLAEDIHRALSAAGIDASKKLHFVGYSMGGLVIRAYLHRHRPENLGRVVLIGTPNHGSEVADFLNEYPLYQDYFGPAGAQLTTDQRSVRKLLGPVDYDLGVIAGKLSVDPVSSVLLIPGDDDGKVSIESTKLASMKDHIVLNTTHAFMLNNPFVLSQTLAFIENGRFDREEAEKKDPVYNP